jgi:hypothetical protein
LIYTTSLVSFRTTTLNPTLSKQPTTPKRRENEKYITEKIIPFFNLMLLFALPLISSYYYRPSKASSEKSDIFSLIVI